MCSKQSGQHAQTMLYSHHDWQDLYDHLMSAHKISLGLINLMSILSYFIGLN